MSKMFIKIVGSSWVQFDYTLISKSLFVLMMSVMMVSCKNKKEDILFKLIDSEHSGITFSNEIAPTKDLNIFNYMYFYNGGGVGAGDLNNDGLADLIFTALLFRSTHVTLPGRPPTCGKSFHDNSRAELGLTPKPLLQLYQSF